MATGFREIRLSNFRSFEQAIALEPSDECTWLMGRNGSGKSNLLDALVFPCDLLRAPREALSAEWRGRPTASGSVDFAALLYDPKQPAAWDLTFEDDVGDAWRYRLVLTPVERTFRVSEERLERLDAGGPRSMLENGADGARILLAEGRWQSIASTERALALGSAATLAGAPAAHALRFLQGVWMFRPDPLLMRGDRVDFTGEGVPDRYGRDNDALLEHFIGEQPEDVSALLESIAEVTGWRRMRVSRDASGRRVMFAETDVRWLPMAFASDGQLLAAWLSRLAMSPPAGWTVALMDEPAVALGPDVQELVWGWLSELSRWVQVIAATHDKPAVNRASRSSVFLVERKRGAGSRLTRLDQHPVSNEWSDLFKAGEVAEQAMRDGAEKE